MKAMIPVAILLLVGLSACSSTSSTPSNEPVPTAAGPAPSGGNPSVFEQGPTTVLDDGVARGRSNLLERMDEASSENDRLRQEISQLRARLDTARSREQSLSSRMSGESSSRDRERGLLSQLRVENEQLKKAAVEARIGKARAEQELLRLKLASLAPEER